ncbi:MAG: T9SS type A sorting domain-containing protein, partial [Chitinophagales bacterium]
VSQSEYMIFPNPSNGKFSIQLTEMKMRDGELAIFDQTGRTVFQSADLKSETFDLDLIAGIYLLRYSNEIGTWSERLIISE